MNIHEYQAKELFKKYNIPVQKGIVILSKEEVKDKIDSLDFDVYVIKAQIHAGGRGKAGGIKLAYSKFEAQNLAYKMFDTVLVTSQTGVLGQNVSRVYVECGSEIIREFYFSAIFDRNNNSITFVLSNEGGIDIEELAIHNPEKIIRVFVNPLIGIKDFHFRQILSNLNLDNSQKIQMIKIIKSVYRIFVEKDALQIEINPLVIEKNGNLIPLDAKITFDDNSLFKHSDVLELRDTFQEDPLERKAADFGISYVKMNGNIGCMVNGAGLAMATMDLIKLYGAEPANFLDVGGGADKEKVSEALKIILADNRVNVVLVNIFGGIMRCDTIAHGLILAVKECGIKVPLVVRLSGTNFEAGLKLLANSKLKIFTATDLSDAGKKIIDQIKK